MTKSEKELLREATDQLLFVFEVTSKYFKSLQSRAQQGKQLTRLDDKMKNPKFWRNALTGLDSADVTSTMHLFLQFIPQIGNDMAQFSNLDEKKQEETMSNFETAKIRLQEAKKKLK